MSDLLEGLNDPQRRAVEHSEGPLLVLAGPGSGKTRVITRRVAYLIRHHSVRSENILALTFTNKAADEMRRRLAELIEPPLPLATTFHRFCARILRQYSDLVGLGRDFTILDQKDRDKVLAETLSELDIDSTYFPVDGFERKISQLKNELVEPTSYEQTAIEVFDRTAARVYARYTERLTELNAVDFDDLLFFVARLLREQPALRAHLDGRYRYVLVDEYQDTNLAQYAIARGLSIDFPNLCVTGDPDQSIYGWRGADLGNILSFEADFPGCQVLRLENNYRSTGHIVAVADQLIRNNSRRKAKDLVTENPPGAKVVVVCHTDDNAEAAAIAVAIRNAVNSGQRRYRDFAVFLRVSGLSRSVEAAFRGYAIPYQLIGGYSFFERKEIRDVLAYAKVIQNPRDDLSVARAIGVPPRGVGQGSLDRLGRSARQNRRSLREELRHAEVAGVRGKPLKGIRAFSQLLDDLAPIVSMRPADAIEAIICAARMRDFDSDEDADEEAAQRRVAYLDELVASAHGFSESHPDADFAEFLEAISLVSDSDRRDDRADVATIMTLHAAKGLEFPVVFMIAFEMDILPHSRSVEQGNEEEERRLAFVGITRAQEELTLSYVMRRVLHGRATASCPSVFLTEIPSASLDRQDTLRPSPACRPEFIDDYSQETGFEEPSIQVVRAPVAASPADRFRRGMRVEHPRHGQGIILQIDGNGKDRKATIEFSTIGVLRVVLDHFPIEPILA